MPYPEKNIKSWGGPTNPAEGSAKKTGRIPLKPQAGRLHVGLDIDVTPPSSGTVYADPRIDFQSQPKQRERDRVAENERGASRRGQDEWLRSRARVFPGWTVPANRRGGGDYS